MCILRLSALGDATHVLPLIRTLQKNLPEAKITWILGKGEAKLMEGLDGVELIADLPKEFELATVYTAAIGTLAQSPENASQFIALLAGPEASAQRAAGGFEV